LPDPHTGSFQNETPPLVVQTIWPDPAATTGPDWATSPVEIMTDSTSAL
jgi:hypothetical protein